MKILNLFLTWGRALSPIPAEYRKLAPLFYQDSTAALQHIIRLIGLVMGAGVLTIFLVNIEHYDRLETAVTGVSISVALCWVITSYRPPRWPSINLIFFLGSFIFLAANWVETLYDGHYINIFGIFLALSLTIPLVPWPTSWTIRIEGTIILLALLTHYRALQTGPHNQWNTFTLLLIMITSTGSIFSHFLMTRQRWESFLNRHRVQQLNRQLQTTNTRLETLTNRLHNELALAREIQKGLLPPACPNWPGLELVCYSKPARHVGGDFYAYHLFRSR